MHDSSRNPLLLPAVLSALWLTATAHAQAPVLVKDIQPGATGSSPAFLVDVDGMLFFSADDGVAGGELWRSDGTAAGTVLVKDINTGTGGSSPGQLFPYRGRLALSALGDLFLSDGTAAGTGLVRRIEPSGPSQVRSFVEMGGILYFSAWPQALGAELWRSDGTALGTYMVKDIAPGGGNSGFLGGTGLIANVGGRLLLSADQGSGSQLWSSYGTEASTVLVKTINATGSANVTGLTPFGSRTVFLATDGVAGRELWITDGTSAGTMLLKDLNPGSGHGDPSQMVVLGNSVLFTAIDGTNGRELWKTDGTPAGTVLVKDINPGSAASNPQQLRVAGTTVFFFADDGVSGLELWKSDGTAAGTVLVSDIQPGTASGASTSAASLAVGQGAMVVFAANDGVSGLEPWVSNGTAAGTWRLGDLAPGAAGSAPNWFRVSGSQLFFAANDGVRGSELWSIALRDLGANLALPFGAGCQGVTGSGPRIGANGPATLGNMTFAITVDGVYGQSGAMLLGASTGRLTLGFGCTLYVPVPTYAASRTFFTTTSSVTLPIPNLAGVLGFEAFAQWVIRDPGSLNGTYALSDALRIVVGR